MLPVNSNGFSIGSLVLDTPILLAPMAGYTDLAFRLTVRELGGMGLAYTEMINPRSLLSGGGRKRKAILATAPEDRPLGYQLYGRDPIPLADAARWLQERGAPLIDINMGCPQRKIAGSGAGAGLLRQPQVALKVVESVLAAVSIPVTAKIRLGWDAKSVIAAALACDLEKAGVAAITVHGRTCGQKFLGEADRAAICRVVDAVDHIPVIGNGDITSVGTALQMLRETGCRGIMLGRGALREPWLIRDIWQALQGSLPLSPPTTEMRVNLICKHYDRSVAIYGESAAAVLFRKWVPLYGRKLGLRRDRMIELLTLKEPTQMRSALTRIGNPENSAL